MLDIDEKTLRELNGTTDYSMRGKCSQCGNCCEITLPLTEKEIQDIEDYVIKENIKLFFSPITTVAKCPYRDDYKKKCLIYDKRPLICKAFRCWDLKNTIIHHQKELLNEERKIYNILFLALKIDQKRRLKNGED